MGIKVEFNPDLALRDYSEFINGNRKEEECIPKLLEKGKIYNFLKEGQRVYWLTDDENWGKGQLPLMKTEGNQKLSRPIGSIKIIEITHILINGKVYTRGLYQVIDIFDENDDEIKFESYRRVK